MRATGLFRPLSTQNEHRSPRNGARFFVFSEERSLCSGGHAEGMACSRAGRGTGAGRCGDKSAESRSGVGGVRKKRVCCPRGEWGCGEWRGQLTEEMRVCPRGEWGGGEWRGQLAEMNGKFAPRHLKRGIKIASERHNRRRCHVPHSPPCESRSHREAEAWESAHRAGRACGDNARKRNEGAGRPDRRPRFRHNGTSPDRAHTSTVPCRPPHGAPNGARQRWKARETPCCAPSCPTAPRSRPTKGRNPPPPMRAAPAAAPRWDECRGARVFLLREWS